MKFSQPGVLLLLFLDAHLVPLLDHSILGFPIVHEGVADGGVAMFRTFLLQESHRYIALPSRVSGEQKNLAVICGRWRAQNFFCYVDPTRSSIGERVCGRNCELLGYRMHEASASRESVCRHRGGSAIPASFLIDAELEHIPIGQNEGPVPPTAHMPPVPSNRSSSLPDCFYSSNSRKWFNNIRIGPLNLQERGLSLIRITDLR